MTSDDVHAADLRRVLHERSEVPRDLVLGIAEERPVGGSGERSVRLLKAEKRNKGHPVSFDAGVDES